MRLSRLSRLGIVLCALYLCAAIPLDYMVLRAQDVKEAYAYAMLATLPAGLFLSVTGLISSVIGHWWLTNVITQTILSAALVYLLGWAIEAIARSAAR